MNTNRLNSLALGLAFLLAACGGSGTTTDSNTATPAAMAPIPVGKPGKATGMEITVNSVTESKMIAGDLGPKAEASETFVVIRYTLKNTATAPLGWGSRPEVTLVDGKGQMYASDTTASVTAAGINNDIQDAMNDLNPNVSGKSTAVWKVDKASFDRATCKLLVASDPSLTFALK